MPGWWYAISAASFLDRLTRNDDTLALARRGEVPSLFVRGDQEPRDAYPAEEFRARAGGPCTVENRPGLRPLLQRREETISALVATWLRGVLHL